MNASEKPAYTLGYKFSRLVRAVIYFAVSFAAFIAVLGLSKKYPATGQQPNLVYMVSPGIAGVVQIVFFFVTFTMLIFGATAVIYAILYFRTGTMLLYDDHVNWKRPGKEQRLEYSDLNDAYFGYMSAPTGNYSAGQPNYSFSRQISFYVGDRRLAFTVSMKHHAGIDKYMESRIPKKNIDVEDD